MFPNCFGICDVQCKRIPAFLHCLFLLFLYAVQICDFYGYELVVSKCYVECYSFIFIPLFVIGDIFCYYYNRTDLSNMKEWLLISAV